MVNSWLKKPSILLLLLSWPLICSGQFQKKKLQTGDMAPVVSLGKILQANQTLRGDFIRSLKGKVVVLEFWATWCGPCRKAIPHLNELSKAYRAKPVRFIAVTNEEEWRVKNFLKYTPIDSWIGLDLDGSLTFAYDVLSWPKTVVIDANGRIAAVMHPMDLDRKFIDNVLAGRKAVPEVQPALPSTPAPTPPAVEEKTEPPLLQIEIRPAKSALGMNFSDDAFRAAGMTLADLLSLAYQVNRARMVFTSPEAEKSFAVTIKAPFKNYDRMYILLQETLAKVFHFALRKETRQTEVLVLSMPKAGNTLLIPAKTRTFIRSDDGQITSDGTTIAFFANTLEDKLNRIVIDETAMPGNFDIALYWDTGNPDSVFSAVREQMGLVLKKEIRPIEFSIFE